MDQAIFPICIMDRSQLIDLLAGIIDLSLHPSILHNTFLHVLNMDVLFRTDIFLYKIFQADVHTERNGPLKKQWELFAVKTS